MALRGEISVMNSIYNVMLTLPNGHKRQLCDNQRGLILLQAIAY